MCYPVYGGKQTSVLRNGCEIPGREKQSNLKEGHVLQARMKISVLILGFYGYIGYIEDISVFINYSKFKDIFNLYIKISLNVYEMIISIRFEKTIKIHFL